MSLGVDMGADEVRGFGVTKAGPITAAPVETITYRLAVVNLEASPVSNVVFTDTLPLEVRYVSQQAVGLDCAHDGAAWGGLLACTVTGGVGREGKPSADSDGGGDEYDARTAASGQQRHGNGEFGRRTGDGARAGED
ncbi:MAG: DUF11 domain-containing protein [Anaerolineae bacterium]|nr:DUF11 domain-containing protein [Anaerolineae bacterium]